jgi:glycosyltransferase involved in cell wall biosynthesis
MTRIGQLTYATRQGLGTLGKMAHDNGLADETMVFRHGRYLQHLEWYPEGTIELVNRPFNGPMVDAWLDRVDWVLFWETPWDWSFPDYCRNRGKCTALVSMYEWFPKKPAHKFDRLIAPSLLDRDLIEGSVYLPIPVQERPWHQRTKARRFLHNAGHIGWHEHKGTRQILEAMKYVTKPIQLIVRAQEEAASEFWEMHRRFGYSRREHGHYFPVMHRFPPSGAILSCSTGEFAGDDILYPDDCDVFLMAEKYNGESLPLKEARASGMLVMTSDRYPMNTWLNRDYLIPVKGYYKSRVSGAYLEFDEAEVNPRDIAAKLDQVYDTDISQESLRGREWAEEMSWENWLPKWREVLT